MEIQQVLKGDLIFLDYLCLYGTLLFNETLVIELKSFNGAHQFTIPAKKSFRKCHLSL